MASGPPPAGWAGGGQGLTSPGGRMSDRSDARRTACGSLVPVADAAADGPSLGDLDRLALQQGVDRVADVLLGDLALVAVVVHRAGVADGAGLVEDEELRGVGRAEGLADLLA